MNETTPHDYEAIKTIFDELFHHQLITFHEWYLALMDLRTQYGLVVATRSQ